MKSTTSEKRKKHPATRGDVFKIEGAKPRPQNVTLRDVKMGAKFTTTESREVAARAAAAGMSVSELIRDRVLSGPGLSRETTLVLAAMGRVRLLLTRLRAVDEGQVDSSLAEVEQWVDGVSERAATLIAAGGKLPA